MHCSYAVDPFHDRIAHTITCVEDEDRRQNAADLIVQDKQLLDQYRWRTCCTRLQKSKERARSSRIRISRSAPFQQPSCLHRARRSAERRPVQILVCTSQQKGLQDALGAMQASATTSTGKVWLQRHQGLVLAVRLSEVQPMLQNGVYASLQALVTVTQGKPASQEANSMVIIK